MASDIGSKAQIPNPALQPFDRIVGEWRTTGTHPGVPNTTLHGRTSFAWQDGGAFLVWRSQIDDPRFPNCIAVFGSDDEAKTTFISYFDERGISRKYDIILGADGDFIMQRIDPKFSQRMSFTIGADRMACKGKMSRDGGAWEGDLSLTYERMA
jgi:hypothetical protein